MKKNPKDKAHKHCKFCEINSLGKSFWCCVCDCYVEQLKKARRG